MRIKDYIMIGAIVGATNVANFLTTKYVSKMYYNSHLIQKEYEIKVLNEKINSLTEKLNNYEKFMKEIGQLKDEMFDSIKALKHFYGKGEEKYKVSKKPETKIKTKLTKEELIKKYIKGEISGEEFKELMKQFK